jgi:hypothetical protein
VGWTIELDQRNCRISGRTARFFQGLRASGPSRYRGQQNRHTVSPLPTGADPIGLGRQLTPAAVVGGHKRASPPSCGEYGHWRPDELRQFPQIFGRWQPIGPRRRRRARRSPMSWRTRRAASASPWCASSRRSSRSRPTRPIATMRGGGRIWCAQDSSSPCTLKSLSAHALRSLIIAPKKLAGRRVTLENQIRTLAVVLGGRLPRALTPPSTSLSKRAKGLPVSSPPCGD